MNMDMLYIPTYDRSYVGKYTQTKYRLKKQTTQNTAK